MRSILLIPIEYSRIAVLENLATSLNACQTEFRFHVFRQPVKLRKAQRTGVFRVEVLEHTAFQCAQDGEYPVIISECKIEEFTFFRFEDTFSIISTRMWPQDSREHPVKQYLTYSLIDALMSLYVELDVHDPIKGCIADNVQSVEEIKLGIKQSDYCSACTSKISGSVGRKLSVQEGASIYRMLDQLAGRRNCFVLMPFDKTFDPVYKKLVQLFSKSRHPVIATQKWECKRADSVFHGQEVMRVVWERILRAEVIIADLTNRNPNVFYELGYAHAVNKNTILITQSIDDVPFDLRHHQLIEYAPTLGGLKKLVDAVVRYL